MTMTQKTPEVSATLTEKGLSLIIDGKPYTVAKTHLNYNRILDALRAKEYTEILDMVDVSRSLSKYSEGRVVVEHGRIFYDGEEQHNALTTRMIEMMRLGIDITNYVRFMNRLMKNPSYNSVEQLYKFMEACDLPITPDGRLLCYKSVNQDYYDTHTGKTFLNTPGAIIEMPRNKVNDDPTQSCSYGLHVCSQSYGMYGKLLLYVAVDPADVVSVPNDYSANKMRVCKYEVLKEVEDNNFRDFEDEPVYNDDDVDWEEDDDELFNF